MNVSGIGGELLAGGYQLAARIGSWTLRSAESDDGWLVSFSLSFRDEFWMTQRPMRLTLRLGELNWSWDNIEYNGGGSVRVVGRPNEGMVVKEDSPVV